MAEAQLFHDGMTLRDARDALRELLDEGHRCPCCTQFAKIYQRKINSGMAHSLIGMYRAAGTEWQHIPTTIGSRSREEGKLRYWGLAEEELEVRREDGGRAGFWRVTVLGEAFVLKRVAVPKYARIFDSRRMALVGDKVSIVEALGDKFSYAELMGLAHA